MKPEKAIDEFEKDYREKMIKQKEDYDKMKEKESDSDLIFNEKDNKKNKVWNTRIVQSSHGYIWGQQRDSKGTVKGQ